MQSASPLGITDVVLRDASQSLLATRVRIEDMLPIAEKLDQVGYWSLETWGGATFDSCIRYLGEDPWERIRLLKAAMPNTPQQMLFRAQNILGYRHYADDVVEKFVERAAINGVDVFRVFDAMNDMRNLTTALAAVKKVGKHAQGTMSYTLSPVHNLDLWIDMACQIEDMGADSVCIKDMAGLLKPMVGYELVSRLKQAISIPVQLHCHATTGMSTTTIHKCVEAGIDRVDTSISSMSMTYGHSPTETVVAILEDTERPTGLDIVLLEEIAAYFRTVRQKYANFEGSLRGVDSRILVAQVPGGMLTNMESQLKEQNSSDKLDEVLEEIPRVRKDLGYIPLVTPTSQIVGTQAVLNVLSGERYKVMSKETQGVLKGEYGAAPAPVNAELQQRVLEGAEAITCRPADLLEPELKTLQNELLALAKEKGITLTEGEGQIDDVLTYALFPQVGLKFLENRGDTSVFEPVPTAGSGAAAPVLNNDGEAIYTVEVESKKYLVSVTAGGDLSSITPAGAAATDTGTGAPLAQQSGEPIAAPLAGNVMKVVAGVGSDVKEGDTLLLLEAMKMETAVSSPRDGKVIKVNVSAGDAVSVGDSLVELA
jgi:oxaloacetate decarboxylase alpha subunit|tara:strand:- start:25759 stop:27549 length:1791 start_codon:yes stop_codon:yes gene_type:complete